MFYLPHHPVIRESAESTKMRIVYDASSKTAPNLPKTIVETLVPRYKISYLMCWFEVGFHPVALNGDIRKAFLYVRIRLDHRDALRFHWLEDKKSSTYLYATIHPSTVWNGSISVPVGRSVTVSCEC